VHKTFDDPDDRVHEHDRQNIRPQRIYHAEHDIERPSEERTRKRCDRTGSYNETHRLIVLISHGERQRLGNNAPTFPRGKSFKNHFINL